ncbi:LysR substrate binding domain-containing protein [Pseudovibrio axinellae]|nr:LysR substrate binding domain-containing protein [Pseudovibrio axinellae]
MLNYISSPDEVEGIVRVSVSESVGIEILPTMLASLRIHHPKLRLELVLTNGGANLLE